MKILCGVLGLFLLVAAAHAAQPVATLRIDQAWARPSPPGADTGAGYLTVTNESGVADAIVAADSPVASRTEVHESTLDAGGVMRMRRLPSVPLPPRQSVRLQPGGMHLMFIGLQVPLTVGTRVAVILRFAHAPSRTVELIVESRDSVAQ